MAMKKPISRYTATKEMIEARIRNLGFFFIFIGIILYFVTRNVQILLAFGIAGIVSLAYSLFAAD